ncbi:phosphate ABC transporter permease PstA [Oricola cellulosilytica]|uniref:Phosphate transport system permease protein PstA n=1 Tax=Oricola cellulosilytica TaxID=1429082 RepID=A0A4R0PF90_9HYPH|nr:phosphate ABC transporter permease PstA [Oricola cellulosilytica]
MTDTLVASPPRPAGDLHTNDNARRRLKARYGAESRFKWIGAGAVVLSGLFLLILLSTIVTQALPAFRQNYIALPLDLSQVKVDEGNFQGIVQDALYDRFPEVEGRQDRKLLRGLITSGAGVMLRKEVESNPSIVGSSFEYSVPLDDFADLYLKGLEARKDAPLFPDAKATPSATTGEVSVVAERSGFAPVLEAIKADLLRQAELLERNAERLTAAAERDTSRVTSFEERLAETEEQDALRRRTQQIEDLRARISSFEADAQRYERDAATLRERASKASGSEPLTDQFASYLVNINDGVMIVKEVEADVARGQVVIPFSSVESARSGEWSLVRIPKPESFRKITDKEIVWIDRLNDNGRIESRLNTIFLGTGASREPELAGIWGAAVGSALTMIVTMLLSFPIGVAAAIYLEEFAPKNRFTQLIEVNINNLAAVPSIVFGLLGLAVFLNWFAMPRSAPLVGGMVLALMTLPTIIIASRAALRAVPPSIREAALGIGASRIQTVMHHVLPLAMPGIFTGTIIGMAQALGETAPLLMIGMVAFIVDIPGGFTDPATVLPVQIYMWADFPEPAFQQKTSAAILLLLVFLVVMNAVAVLLRRRFERRW